MTRRVLMRPVKEPSPYDLCQGVPWIPGLGCNAAMQ